MKVEKADIHVVSVFIEFLIWKLMAEHNCSVYVYMNSQEIL